MFDAYISDTHFFHKNIIKYCDRPFSSVEEQTEELIKRYNSVVGRNDKVLWLGDCFFSKNSKAREVLDRMNGQKYLVIGNHDTDNYHDMVYRGFDFVVDKLYTKIGKREVLFCHYDQWEMRSPFDDRYQNLRPTLRSNQVLVHGHTHQKSKTLLNQVHVGVDAWDFTPATREKVHNLIQVAPSNDSKEFKEELILLKEYSSIIKDAAEAKKQPTPIDWVDLHQAQISSACFDKFRCLGWEREWKSRTM